MIDASTSTLAQHIQHLHELDLEEGKAYIQAHISELQDYLTVGELLAQEALDKLYTPLHSLKLAELLTFYGEYTNHKHSYALGLKAKGDVLFQIGHYQDAMECLDIAGEEFLRLGEEGDWARSRISWVLSCGYSDNVERALQEAERARQIFVRLDEPFWVCAIDQNVAIIYDYIGRYHDALILYECMRQTYSTITTQNKDTLERYLAIAEMNEAICLGWTGEFEKAYYLLQQAQKRFNELHEIDLLIAAEVNLAELDYVQGYYGSAFRRYYQVHDNMLEYDAANPILLAEIKLWKASCLVKLHRAQEACLLTTEVVEMELRTDVSLNRVFALREYATALAVLGNVKQALLALHEALKVCDKLSLNQQGITIALQEAELLLKTEAIYEAYERADVLKKYFESRNLVAFSTRAALVMVDALLKQAKLNDDRREMLLEEGINLCKDIINQARQANLQDIVYKSYSLRAQLTYLYRDSAKATRYYRIAVAQIERMLDDLHYDLSPSFLQETWMVYADSISLYLEQSKFEQAFNFLERARSMALRQYLSSSNKHKTLEEQQRLIKNSATTLKLQQELRDWQERYRDYSVLLAQVDTTGASMLPGVRREIIQDEVKRCEDKLSELFERLSLSQEEPRVVEVRSKRHHRRTLTLHQFDVRQLREQLEPEQALLAYFLHEGRLVIFVATKEKLTAHEVPDGVEQLERLLPLLHARLLPDSQSPQAIHLVRGLLRKLYNLLIAPIVSQLPASGSLTIVPYGPLHKLPFHALYDGTRYLIESFQISYLPTSHLLLKTQRTDDASEERVAKKQPMILGYSGQGHLPHALDEAKMLATLLGGTCYLEEEATIERLLREAEGSPLIHLATHGHSRLDAPNFSSVLLADGQLNALDAFGLNLSQCELVTLSGCETGLSLSGGGDEQLGLGRAFLAAGAKSLVMSLWPVEDAATSELMQHFYQHLLRGESRIAALRNAQCALLHSSSHAHPYFWAAFRLVGETGPIRW